MLYDTETPYATLHPSANINITNRHPEMGVAFEGFPGNTTPVVEMETSGHVFLTAREATDLGVRLIQHATLLMQPLPDQP
jgi:hypothetical protein